MLELVHDACISSVVQWPAAVGRRHAHARAQTLIRPCGMEDREQVALRRAALHMFTTLDVSRRKWAVLSRAGKEALTDAVNHRLRLAHAEGLRWPRHLQAARPGVISRALSARRTATAAVHPVLEGLSNVVVDMRSAVEAMRARGGSAITQRGATWLRQSAILHGEAYEQLGQCLLGCSLACTPMMHEVAAHRQSLGRAMFALLMLVGLTVCALPQLPTLTRSCVRLRQSCSYAAP